MPFLHDKRWVANGVHGNNLCSGDLGRSSICEDPSKEIPPSGKPATNAAISPSRNGSPVIDSTRGWHGGGEFGNGSCNEPVEEGYDEELIEDARGAAVVDCDGQAPSDGYPDVSACDGKPTDGKEAEVAVELLLVARCVDRDLGEGDFWVYPVQDGFVV